MNITMEFLILYPESEINIINQIHQNLLKEIQNLKDKFLHQNLIEFSSLSAPSDLAALHEAQSDYEDFIDELNQSGIRMILVALQSLCERTLKRVLHHKTPQKDLRNLSRQKIEKILEEHGILLEKIPGYDVFTKTWEKSNSIKHDIKEPSSLSHKELENILCTVSGFLKKVCAPNSLPQHIRSGS